MLALKALAKVITMGTAIVSFVAITETYYDNKFYSADFMDNVESVNIDFKSSRIDNRFVASNKRKNLPHIQKVSMDKASLIHGEWKILKIFQVFDDEESVVFDAIEGRDREVSVNMELIGLSTVEINGDLEQTYMVSLLTEKGTIALFKEYGDGFEIVEARRVLKKKGKKKSLKKKLKKSKRKKEEKIKFNMEEDLYLVSAVDPQRGKGVVKGELVEGLAHLKNNELILESAQIYIGTEKETEILSTEARIKAHGTFNDERGNQGIVTITNKNEIKVRFSTGVLQGAMLNFATYERKIEIEDEYERLKEGELADESLSNDDAGERRERGEALDEIREQIEQSNIKPNFASIASHSF